MSVGQRCLRNKETGLGNREEEEFGELEEEGSKDAALLGAMFPAIVPFFPGGAEPFPEGGVVNGTRGA